MSLLLVALLNAALARELRVGVVSDAHIMPNYDPYMNNSCYCTVGCTMENIHLNPLFYTDQYAPLGRIFCDSPPQLVDSMLEKLQREAPDLDVLFVTGDIVGHGYAQDPLLPYNPSKFETLMKVHRDFSLKIG